MVKRSPISFSFKRFDKCVQVDNCWKWIPHIVHLLLRQIIKCWQDRQTYISQSWY